MALKLEMMLLRPCTVRLSHHLETKFVTVGAFCLRSLYGTVSQPNSMASNDRQTDERRTGNDFVGSGRCLIDTLTQYLL
jgi:hypothetical protein